MAETPMVHMWEDRPLSELTRDELEAAVIILGKQILAMHEAAIREAKFVRRLRRG